MMTIGYTYTVNPRVYMTIFFPVPLDTDASRTNGRKRRRIYASLSQSLRKKAFGNEREEDLESGDKDVLFQISLVSFWLALFDEE